MKAQITLDALANFALALALVTLFSAIIVHASGGFRVAGERLEAESVLASHFLLATSYSLGGWHISEKFPHDSGVTTANNSIHYKNSTLALLFPAGDETIELAGEIND